MLKVGEYVKSLITTRYLISGRKYKVGYVGKGFISVDGEAGYADTLSIGEFTKFK